jgi:hypothetical protein
MASSLSAQAGGRPFFLTKSRFLQALQCPRKLRYAHAREPRTTPSSSFQQQLALDGQKMGVYARLLFPHGTLIGQGHTTHTEALVAHTTSLLQSPDDVTVVEGAVRHGHCLIRADLLHKKSKDTTNTTTHLHVMEVKAKAWDARLTRDEQLCGKRGGITAAWLPYIQDVAFQTLVLRRAFPQSTIQSSLVLPDKAKRNTSIPGLYGMFATDPSGQVFLPEDAQQRILAAKEEEDDDLLLQVVEIDDLVERVLTSALVFPGSTGEDFCTVVDQWEENIRQYEEEGDTTTPTTTSSPSVIGLHCRDCEYRLPAEPASAHPDEKATVVSGFRKCWKEATGLALDQDYPQKAETLVIDLYAGGRTTTKLMAEKMYQFANVTPQDLGLDDDGVDPKNVGKAGMSRSERQWYQVHDNCTRDEDGNSRDNNNNNNNNKIILDQEYLQKAMATWQYPYHFIDFETILPALPYTVDKHPFQTLAFQFSHHTLHADGRLEHTTQFLHTEPGTCPNRPFLDALQTSLGDNNVGSKGTVFRWGSHENTVLAALLQSEAYESTMLASLLTKGDRAMVDLMALVTKCYYVAGSGASSSIKKVLLPTLATSETLREVYSRPNYTALNFSDFQWWVAGEDGLPCDPYKLLTSEQADSATAEVSHGGDAIVAYHALQQSHLLPEERRAIRAALLRYCELDTLAMVMILQALQGMLTPE